MPHPSVLDPNRSALVVVDYQEAFRGMIDGFDEIAAAISRAVRGFDVLGLPVIVTEQYPKGLGHTIGEIASILPPDTAVIEKTAFSCCGAGAFSDKLDRLGVRQIVLCGIEAHICVNQTAHDLLDRRFDVHLLLDAVGSRFEINRKSGIRKILQSGAVPSSVEMALFELMRDSRHGKFREIQAIIR